MHDDPVRLGKLNRHVPQDLETIVHKAIDRDPKQRYGSAGALAEDLHRFIEDEPIKARRVSQTERLRRWCRHNPALASLAAAVALLLAVLAFGGVTAAIMFGQVALQERQARADAEEKKGALEEKKSELEISLYFQRIALAHRELTASLPNPRKAEELLNACPTELRCWEWHYLKRLGRVELVVFRDPGNQEINSLSFSSDGTRV